MQIDGDQIMRYPGNSSLVSEPYATSGWSLRADGTLLVRFPSTSQDVIRIVLTPPVPPNWFVADMAFAAPFVVIALAVITDLVLWARFIRAKSKTRIS